ncbi:MAG: DUF45 domain-containing protein, partial [Lachnospiraceae bacterium]|nr:DUF45 domain-containing protein [Lachnospiraceae bacterium]
MDYKLIRSRRRSLRLEVKPEGLIVRAPMYVSKYEIDAFVARHSLWIFSQMEKIKRDQAAAGNVKRLTDAEIRLVKKKAKEIIPGRAEYYARRAGVKYGRISIRMQKTRWGSCSAKGNLNFNCLL